MPDDDDEPLALSATVPPVNVPPLPFMAHLPAELGADASPWLDAYIAFSRHWSPRSYDDFHEACALWLLSTVAARRIMLSLGGARYPNLYIALCARTSLCAKSTVAKIAGDVLRAAGLNFLLAPDDSTPQAYIKAMTIQLPQNYDELPPLRQEAIEQRLAFAAQRGWYYEEFGQKISAMMRENGPMADYRGLLRRLDDCPERYEVATITRGTDEVERPYLALLANVTPADLAPFARKNGALWADGFFARFGFVTPPADAPLPSGQFPKGERVPPHELVTALRSWHERLGTPDVQIVPRLNKKLETTGDADPMVSPLEPQRAVLGEGVYEAFYRYDEALRSITQHNDNTDLDGNYTRFSEKALRIAMLLGSFENGGRIEMRHWARAQAIAERWRANLHALMEQLQDDADMSREADLEDKVMRAIERLGPVTLAILKRDALKTASTEELARILDSLERHGRALVETTRKGTKWYSAQPSNVGKLETLNVGNTSNSSNIQSIAANVGTEDKSFTGSTFQLSNIRPHGGIMQQVRRDIRDGRLENAERLIAEHPTLADWTPEIEEIAALKGVPA